MSALPAPVPEPDATPLDEATLLAMALGDEGSLAVARAVIARLGSVQSVVRAHPIELAGIPGIGSAQASRLAAAFELARRAAAHAPSGWRVRGPADVGDRMLPLMRWLEHEELRVLLLNTKNVVSGTLTVYVGNLAGTSVRVGEVFRDAVRRQAAAVVVVHNHPSGDPTPSADDLRITRELAEAGRLLDIELVDHLVLGGDRWVSLRSLGACG